MGRAMLGLVLAATTAGCPGDPAPCEGPAAVTAMSYNVANLTGDAGDQIAGLIAGWSPDLIAAQECDSCDYLLARLPDRYRLTAPPRAGVAILYDATVWELAEQGVISLGHDDDGWGERVARWARFAELATGRCLYFYSTHFCVTVRSPDDRCDVDRQLDYVDLVVDDLVGRAAGAPALVAGDLNVFDGFESGPVIGALVDAGLVDAFRVADPSGDGTTFVGNDWAPAGRIDYLFATAPVTVDDAAIDRDTIPPGAGSDHYPVVATVVVGE